jgi:hypothetical protein
MSDVKQMVCALISLLAVGCTADVGNREPEVEGKPQALIIPHTVNCDNEQYNRIRAAAENAFDAIVDSENDIVNVYNGGDSTRFDYWFGSHEQDYLAVAYNNFNDMYNLFGDVQYTCDCPGAVPGLVGSTTVRDPNNLVVLCPEFFTQDFQEFSVGGIIHEVSHLVGVIHWQQEGCTRGSGSNWPEALHESAAAFPYGAIQNAENYRLYGLGWHPHQQSSFVCPD